MFLGVRGFVGMGAFFFRECIHSFCLECVRVVGEWAAVFVAGCC